MKLRIDLVESTLLRRGSKLKRALIDEWRAEQEAFDSAAPITAHNWELGIGRVVNETYIPAAGAIWRGASNAILTELRRRKSVDYLESENYARGERWIASRGAALVTEVTETQREALKYALAEVYKLGLSVEDSTFIVRRCVGLTTSQANAIIKYAQRLRDAGVAQKQIQLRINAYAQRALDYRAERIVRTELSKVHHTSQQDVIKRAVEVGDLPPSTVKVWLTAESERTCDECSAMDGATATVDAPFEGGIDAPPLHPNCMCTVSYETER